MSGSIVILVTDNHDFVENARKHFEGQDCALQAYSPEEWRNGVDSPFFRQQLVQGVPALAGGTSPVSTGYSGTVLSFPPPSNHSIQKMDDLEAKAIENAILQYRGNLTEAAKALGIGRATLYRKVKQYQIDPAVARKKKAMAA
jgi:transcriptional regulator of acetoin/glycerol metabolism